MIGEQEQDTKVVQEPIDVLDHFPEISNEILASNQQNRDPTAIHKKLNNYENLDKQQRISLIKNLAIMLQQLGQQGTVALKPILNMIIKDRQDISTLMLQHMQQILHYLQKHNNYQQNIKNIIIPILIIFLNFDSLKIKENSGIILGNLAHQLSDNDRGDFILKDVIQMAHDDNNQENRIVAVQLFSSMSQCFGKQLCQQFIGLEILSLGEDISFRVQKQAIKRLPVISKLVSKQFLSRLLGFFEIKSRGQSNWAIRKACVDIIIQMAELCQKEYNQQKMTEIMLTLLKDSNKWVRISAYKQLGLFIYTIRECKINQKLIHQYTRMVDNDVNSIGRQNEIIYSCAYNFPGVLVALGKQRWAIDLHNVYEKLLKSNDKRIKKTLSQSLHQISKIIGEASTEKYLFKVIDLFFKDPSDDIKLGIIRNMAQIMKVLSIEKRQSLVTVFEEFQKDQKKWRIRQCICKQLDCILQIYSSQTIFQYVLPILLKFCSDTVSIVREQAADKIGDFLTKLDDQPTFQLGLIEIIKGFGTSPKYTQRQSFLIMCQKLTNNIIRFKQHFMNILILLANDKVINVKLVLAQFLIRAKQNKKNICQQEQFRQLWNQLKNDQEDQIHSLFQ